MKLAITERSMGRLPLKVSGNQFGTVNGTRLFGSVQQKISRSNRTSTEKIVLFFRREIRVKFHQSHLGYQFQAFAAPVGTPYNGLYGEAPPQGGNFSRLQVYYLVPHF